VSFLHSFASDWLRISCMLSQVVPALQPLTNNVYLAAVVGGVNPTIPYRSWHSWWAPIILLLLISSTFLACFPKWYQPCNRGQTMSIWQQWANTTVHYKSWHHWWVSIILLLLISCAFLAHLAKWPHPCNCWQLVSFLKWLPSLPMLLSLLIVGTTGKYSSFF